MKISFYDRVDDGLVKFAVIIVIHSGKYVFCKHRDREMLEVPGGHHKIREIIDDTAKRELKEETGAINFDINSGCTYSVK